MCVAVDQVLVELSNWNCWYGGQMVKLCLVPLVLQALPYAEV